MKLSRREILNIPLEGLAIKTKLHFDLNEVPEYMGIRKLKDVSIEGMLRYEPYSKHLLVDVVLSGECVLICSISFKDVDYSFLAEGQLVYGFEDDDEKHILPINEDELDLKPDFLNLIWMEIPNQVIADDLSELPHGENWEVVKEADYRNRDKLPDERLSKLKNFKFEDD